MPKDFPVIRKALLCLLFISMAKVCAAGPFGLDQGMSLSMAQSQGMLRADPSNPNWYDTSALRSGHSSFESYSLLISPRFGLCKIVAVGKDIPTGSHGSQLKSEFKSLQEALNEKYGASKNYDFLHAGSIWDKDGEWMMALQRKERSLASFWTGRPLIDNLLSIKLEAKASSASVGWVTIAYEFNNFDACFAESRSQKNKNL